MSGRVSLSRWTKHPAVYVFGLVFLMRDLILAGLALGGLVAGSLAHQDTLSVVAMGLAALALAGVVASVTGQRRAGGLQAGHDGRARLYSGGGAVRLRARATLAEQPAAHDPVAEQASAGRQLRDEIRDAQERGAWDDEGWAFRKRVETWTERTVSELAGSGRDDLARALAQVEPAPRPPFESLLNGYSASYVRLAGLLDARIDLLERSQG
jgi:hypothetical protein